MRAGAIHSALKVAQTIADLAESDKIETHYLAEAVQCRQRARIGFRLIKRLR